MRFFITNYRRISYLSFFSSICYKNSLTRNNDLYFKFDTLFQILKNRYNNFFKCVITNLIRYNGF